MNDAEKKPELQGKLREFLVMRNLYEAAARQLTLKFEILNDEFSVLYARNPIHHIESRVKTPESIAAKLMKKGLPVSIETAREHVNDIAGVRVVCSYIDDVYRVAEMLERQKDIEIVKRQDYIKTPNYNGYRSLHLDIRVPVYLRMPSTPPGRRCPACRRASTRKCSPSPARSPTSTARCRTCTSASAPPKRKRTNNAKN